MTKYERLELCFPSGTGDRPFRPRTTHSRISLKEEPPTQVDQGQGCRWSLTRDLHGAYTWKCRLHLFHPENSAIHVASGGQESEQNRDEPTPQKKPKGKDAPAGQLPPLSRNLLELPPYLSACRLLPHAALQHSRVADLTS